MSSSQDDNDIVIVAALRTPLCRSRKGKLAKVPPSTLLETALRGVLDKTQINPNDVNDICVGNVLLPANGFAALRMAAICAGFSPETTSLQTTNRQCASGLQAVATIAQAIQTGQTQIGIAAGVESMSMTPMNSLKPPKVDYERMPQAAMDCLLPMGVTSDTVAKEYQLERHVLDQFAVDSHLKAAAAQREGKFDREIVPVGNVSQDDGIRPSTNFATLSKLKPIFTQGGLTTAGNSSQTTDGAAACLLMTRREARRRNLPLQAVWRSYATVGVPPKLMGIGPAVAIPKALQLANLSSVNDIDVFEINEAFASQASWCIAELGIIDAHKVNPCGGAIALGHPLGCTGTRMIATLVQELHRRPGARYGVVSMCVGSGMGAAAVIEVEAAQPPTASKL